MNHFIPAALKAIYLTLLYEFYTLNSTAKQKIKNLIKKLLAVKRKKQYSRMTYFLIKLFNGACLPNVKFCDNFFLSTFSHNHTFPTAYFRHH